MVAALSYFTALVALSSSVSALPAIFNQKSVDTPAVKVAAPSVASADSFWVATGPDFFVPGQDALVASASSDEETPLETITLSSDFGRSTPAASLTAPAFPSITPAPSTNSSGALFSSLSALVERGLLNPSELAPHTLARLSKRDGLNLISLYQSLVASRSQADVDPTPFLPGQMVRASAMSSKSAAAASKSASRSASRASSVAAASSRSAASASAASASTTTTRTTTTSSRTVNVDGTRTTTTTRASTSSVAPSTTTSRTTTTSSRTTTTTSRTTTTTSRTTTTTRATTTTTRTTTTSSRTSTASSSTNTGLTDGLTYWKQKTGFYSLASFIADVVNNANFSWGSSNVAVVTSGPPASEWTNGDVTDSNPALQVAYPAGSRNPGKTPQGGVGFYSSKIDITQATNVSFSYSVFFPTGFDFVKGGKLPGLYGGKKACSGGAEADDCFSTRMMFRKNGMGELYLYAPREKQVSSLCTLGPLSYCNSVYGMSIGRGAWTFKTGEWTDLRQDIWLNTPGQADGGFNIWINGELVLHSDTVYYRNSAVGNVVLPGQNATDVVLVDYDALPSDVVIPNGGFTPGDGLFQPSYVTKIIQPTSTSSGASATSTDDSEPTSWAWDAEARRKVRRTVALAGPTASPAPTAPPALGKRATTVTGFVGAMVQTFFGGSSDDYDSPTLQHTYFKRFELQINA
ncbi:hypothetical protein JCM10207_001823 [Rhodosporidiobolus poonsookiae]